MAKKDFLRWDDIPLDYFLGEFTEDELQDDLVEGSSLSESEPEEQEERVDGVADKNREQTQNAAAYQCPDCPKQYRSISGFRGHVSKKHQKPHLKGSLFHSSFISFIVT